MIVGRSNLVGRPLVSLLLGRERNRDRLPLAAPGISARSAGGPTILVAAAGRPRLVTADMVSPGAAVIDVGTNRTDEGLVGDVDFEAVEEVAGAITPVPGGVGPMTIAMLLVNTLSAARLRASTAATKTAAE